MEGVREYTITVEHRALLYATAGKENGHPVLVFYPLGCSRRTICLWAETAKDHNLWLISCNRPGKGTSMPPETHASSSVSYLETATQDAYRILQHLSVTKVSLLFFCAGTPFALNFAAKFPEITHKMLGIGCWVSPADCDDSKRLFRFASALPSWMLSAVEGVWRLAGRVGSSLPNAPSSLMSLMLTADERELFNEEDNEKLIFAKSEGSDGDHLELAVLLASYKELSLKLPSESPKLIHSQNDELVPIEAARWLSCHWSSELTELESNSHSGSLMLLHPDLRASLGALADVTS